MCKDSMGFLSRTGVSPVESSPGRGFFRSTGVSPVEDSHG